MGKIGTFNERLDKALSVGQTVTLTRRESESESARESTRETDYYEIVVECQTEQFGLLRESASLPVDKTTPGTLVGAIERTAGKITSAVEVISKQTANAVTPAPSPALEPVPENF